ncbi:MAG: hypothetical protein M9898_01355 [Chitinophagaceae bacterium]|nr:hypothetical protein [Chitinophagaceae bacterium]
MKHFTLMMSLFFIAGSLFSQTYSGPGTLSYNGSKYACDIIEFGIPASEAESVIKDRMKALGYLPEKGKGPMVFKNVRISELGEDQAYDLVFDVSRKSRKESDRSIVSLISAKAGELPAGKLKRGEQAPTIVNSPKAPAFLGSFNTAVVQKAYELDILAMAKDLEKSQKELDNLVKEQSKIEKKIQDAQDDLKKNQREQETVKAQIESQKKQLEEKKATPPNQ